MFLRMPPSHTLSLEIAAHVGILPSKVTELIAKLLAGFCQCSDAIKRPKTLLEEIPTVIRCRLPSVWVRNWSKKTPNSSEMLAMLTQVIKRWAC